MYSNYLVPVSLVEGRTGTSSRRSLSLSREGAPHDPKIQYERAMLTLTGLVLLAASAGGIGWFSPLSWDDRFGVQAFGLLRVSCLSYPSTSTAAPSATPMSSRSRYRSRHFFGDFASR